MQPATIELFRNAILRQLAAASPATLTAETLSLGLKAFGFTTFTPAELSTELLYLTQRAFIEESFKTLSPATARYRLSPDGRDYLDKENLL